MKKLRKDKNEIFNILMSREKESITWKVKKIWEIRGKPFGKDEKPWVSKGDNIPHSFELFIM